MTGIGLAVGLSVLGAGWFVSVVDFSRTHVGLKRLAAMQGYLRHRSINSRRWCSSTKNPNEEPYQVRWLVNGVDLVANVFAVSIIFCEVVAIYGVVSYVNTLS